MIIGLCGKSACGKSSLARELVNIYEGKAVHLDIDKVGHEALEDENVKLELANTFGREVLDEDNVSRERLANIVFNSRNEMDKLSEITWSFMEKNIDKFIEINDNKLIILDWLLLPKTKFFDMCDFKVLIDIPYEVRKNRALERDNITEECFDLRESASINYNRKDFDYVFNNNDKENIKKLVKVL